MQDTINSIRVTLNERIGNPFISSTLIACAALNWKLSLLLFSDIPYDSKVEKILGLYPDVTARLDSLLLHPLYFGVFWTLIWPAINIGINAYWHWMKAKTSNVKLWAERKTNLSEAKAAELYAMIDSQESKYLDFLKDRQDKIENLSKQINDLMDERKTLQLEASNREIARTDLESKLAAVQRDTALHHETTTRIRSEKDQLQRELDEISTRSIEFAEYLPGLKAITNAINNARNFQADGTWLRDEFRRQEPSVNTENLEKMINFYLAIGLIKRDSDNHITFGDRYRFSKDKVLGIYNNSPGVVPLSSLHN